MLEIYVDFAVILDRSGENDMIILAPFNMQITAIGMDGGAATDQPAPANDPSSEDPLAEPTDPQ